jgi:hypothetical protein
MQSGHNHRCGPWWSLNRRHPLSCGQIHLHSQILWGVDSSWLRARSQSLLPRTNIARSTSTSVMRNDVKHHMQYSAFEAVLRPQWKHFLFKNTVN